MITAQNLIAWHPVRISKNVCRIERIDTGKVLGRVERTGRTWRAGASQLAFLGDGPASGEPAGDWVPRSLYAPLWPTERHLYLPGEYTSQAHAVAALQRYLDEHQAPALGHGPHPDVQHGKGSR